MRTPNKSRPGAPARLVPIRQHYRCLFAPTGATSNADQSVLRTLLRSDPRTRGNAIQPGAGISRSPQVARAKKIRSPRSTAVPPHPKSRPSTGMECHRRIRRPRGERNQSTTRKALKLDRSAQFVCSACGTVLKRQNATRLHSRYLHKARSIEPANRQFRGVRRRHVRNGSAGGIGVLSKKPYSPATVRGRQPASHIARPRKLRGSRYHFRAASCARRRTTYTRLSLAKALMGLDAKPKHYPWLPKSGSPDPAIPKLIISSFAISRLGEYDRAAPALVRVQANPGNRGRTTMALVSGETDRPRRPRSPA